MDGFVGEIAIDTSAAVSTINVVEAEIEARAAVIFVTPAPELVESPFVPEILLMIATVAEVELHVTSEVTSCVLPSV